jgi:hypothetical protein
MNQMIQQHEADIQQHEGDIFQLNNNQIEATNEQKFMMVNINRDFNNKLNTD